MEPLDALRAGEPEALNWLVNTYADRLLRAAALILGDGHAAEDAVQESLMDAVLNLPHFRGDSSLYTWLYAILVRRCRHQQKWLRRVRGVDVVPKGDLAQNPVQSTESIALRSALALLPQKYREVVVLFYFADLTIAEIAELLRVPQGTVKNRLHRARARLKDILGEDE